MLFRKAVFGLVMALLCSCGNAQSNTTNKIAKAAESIEDPSIEYDAKYFSIPYPNGDIPKGKGVCTDVVIRTYRELGVDLQKLVHEDMKANFNLYPKNWGLKGPDKNIDHRRVPNLMTYFKRQGASLPITKFSSDYRPGDVVAWKLSGGLTHIGVVTGVRSSTDRKRFKIIHNIGYGQVLDDCLFDFEIIGHYRYGLDLVKADEALKYCQSNGMCTNIAILIDMSKHSGLFRFKLFDLKNKKTIKNALVAHGSCSNPWNNDYTKDNPEFSNVPDSHCSSLGKYKIGKRGYSNWGVHFNYKIHGLEPTNSNAFKRTIVLHSWKNIGNEETYPNGSPESWGCPAVSNEVMNFIDPYLKKEEKPVLLWIYK